LGVGAVALTAVVALRVVESRSGLSPSGVLIAVALWLWYAGRVCRRRVAGGRSQGTVRSSADADEMGGALPEGGGAEDRDGHDGGGGLGWDSSRASKVVHTDDVVASGRDGEGSGNEGSFVTWSYDAQRRLFLMSLSGTPSDNDDADGVIRAHVGAMAAHRAAVRAAADCAMPTGTDPALAAADRMRVVYDLRRVSSVARCLVYAARLAGGLRPLEPQFGELFVAQAVVMPRMSMLGAVVSAVTKIVTPLVPLRVWNDVDEAVAWCNDVAEERAAAGVAAQ